MADIMRWPSIIGRTSDGRYRAIVREIVYNAEGIPLVATTVREPGFDTPRAARRHAARLALEVGDRD